MGDTVISVTGFCDPFSPSRWIGHKFNQGKLPITFEQGFYGILQFPVRLVFYEVIIQRSGSGICGFYISDNRCLDRSAWNRLTSRSEPWIGRKTIMDKMILNNCPISPQGNQDEITDSQCIRRELEPWYVREFITYSEGHRLWCRRDLQKSHSHVFIERCSSDWYFVTVKSLIQ